VLRRFKLDELPELWNVIKGEMSLVGPRPDVPGYADCLNGKDRMILELRPGITGPASLVFANEEEILSKVNDPEKYNREVIFPEKVRINLDYYNRRNLLLDLKIIFATIFRTNY
jgi:lipopolysaccharide/colanic/teichoic acid biosynthesis glycosyltransferase